MDNADSIEISASSDGGTELYISIPQAFCSRIGRWKRRFFEMSSRWQSAHCGENESIGLDGDTKLGLCLEKPQYSDFAGVVAP
ncbi:MAG: hypothetical protein M3P08_12080 [Thermoproteota archaeon]|nr:hypothetical protein [Thermoproteota archaeon]